MKRIASILIMLFILAASFSFAEAGEPVVMQKGSKSDDVKALQQRLITLGYLQGTADGIFGDMTRTAVEALQRAYSLEVTGIASDAELDALSEAFREYAVRAVMVAMTNAQATDVFGADGSYDVSKFHNYAYETGSYMTLDSEGIWTETGRDAWRVEDIRFVMQDNETYLLASLDVRFDGESYFLSDVTRIIATAEALDSDAPSQIDEEHMEPSDNMPFLTVPYNLVKDDRESEIQERRAAAEAERAAARTDWIENQFNSENGAHKGLEALILSKISNPEAYKHIETTWVEIVDEDVQKKINTVLTGTKFAQRVEMGDLFIETEFSAGGEDGATSTAYAIVRYDNDSLTLLGIIG